MRFCAFAAAARPNITTERPGHEKALRAFRAARLRLARAVARRRDRRNVLDGRNMAEGKEEGKMSIRYASVDVRGNVRGVRRARRRFQKGGQAGALRT